MRQELKVRRLEKERDEARNEAHTASAKVWGLERELKALKEPRPAPKECVVLEVGDRYRHFKTGGIYKIVVLFTWEPTKEPAVVYESEATGERWGRTVAVFLEEATKPGEEGVKVVRFAPEPPCSNNSSSTTGSQSQPSESTSGSLPG